MSLSPEFIAAITAPESDDVEVALVKLSHPQWPDDIRIARNTKPVQHQGEEYAALGFEMDLPTEGDDTTPVISFEADGIPRDIVDALRSVEGVIKGDIRIVLASTPDTIELHFPDMNLIETDAGSLELRGAFGIEPVLDLNYGKLRLTPTLFPGLHS